MNNINIHSRAAATAWNKTITMMRSRVAAHSRVITAATLLAMLISCTGHIVELGEIGKDDELVLKVDTYAIYADNEDQAFFTVLFNNGDVTGQAEIYDIATGKALTAGNSYTSGTKGEVTFQAKYTAGSGIYEKELISNPKTIKVIAKDEVKKFYRNCGVLRFSGTWCKPCYTLGQTFGKAHASYPDRTVVVTAHVSTPAASDPLANEAAEAAKLEIIGQNGTIPQIYFDFRDKIDRGGVAQSEIESYLKKSIETFPATCGIEALSTIAGETATVSVTVTGEGGKEYYLTVALIEDGIKSSQVNDKGVAINDYIHNNTLRSLGRTSVRGGISLGTIADRQKVAAEQLTYDLTGCEISNCRFAIWVTCKDEKDGNFYVDNAAYCPANGSVRIAYDL